MLLTIALAAGAATLTWALLRLRRLQPAAVYQAETVGRLSGHAITALARVVVLAADVLHVLSRTRTAAAAPPAFTKRRATTRGSGIRSATDLSRPPDAPRRQAGRQRGQRPAPTGQRRPTPLRTRQGADRRPPR